MRALTILLVLPCVALAARESILWRGESIAVEDASGHVLVSPSGSFSCGFREVATNAYTLAIWFTASVDSTVAWMANRDAPVNGRGSRAEFCKDGSLVLRDVDGKVVWSTDTGGTTADRARLLDTGNLVVADAGGRTLWQSFDWPTDTLLPEQPITRYKKLVSASARGLPYSGFNKLYFDSNNILNLIYDGPEISSNYWPDPSKIWWDNDRTAYNSSRYGSLDKQGRFSASDGLRFNASDMGDGVTRRLTLDYDGNLRLYSLDAGSWHVTWVALPRQCDVHGICGRYGVCTYARGPTCSCPDGFIVNNRRDWSKGCRRKFGGVRCGVEDVYFAEMPLTDYWGFDINYTVEVSLETCRHMCLHNCDCEAFGYKKGGRGKCYPKIALWNGRAPDTMELQTIYLKVPSRVKNLNPSVLQFHDNACIVDKLVSANISSSYLQIKGGMINFVYFYYFLAGLFVMESFFIAAGYLFIFRADAAVQRIYDQGYRMVLTHFRRFTYDELSIATCNFSDEVGRSTSGVVYKGILDDGRVVAVTRMGEVTHADEVFRSDLGVIGRINHMNLVRIWGFCSEHAHRLLVSEYVENGSLDRALFDAGEGSSGLRWQTRHEIAVGVAQGLAYLHHECLEWIVHCDVKPENILLGADLEPKITDFALAKLLSRDAVGRAVSRVQGTCGYIAPEWALSRPITGKADVYSFGVVLLELLRGQRVRDLVAADSKGGKALAIDFQRLVAWPGEETSRPPEAWLEEFVDPRLRGDFNHLQAAVMLEVAVSCLDYDPDRRPNMDAVVRKLL